jgi:hypothetical protein
MSNNSDKNWWEFYGIRYAQGTVIGAMIVYFLFSQNENLKKLLFLPTEAKDFGMAHLVLLAIYGLTYCYIASAPILVLHAGRAMIFKSAINPNPYDGMISRILWLFIFSLTVPSYLATCGVLTVAEAGAWSAYLLLVFFQLQIVINIFNRKWKMVIRFYKKIIERRQKPENSGYVESYKHMREHGNSFLIVIFQMLLALPLYILACAPGIAPTTTIKNLFIILLFWTVPAAFIWAFATKIENNLQKL